MLARAQGILVIISIVFITTFIVIILVEKDTLESTETHFYLTSVWPQANLAQYSQDSTAS